MGQPDYKDLKVKETIQAIPGILYRADSPPFFTIRFISDEVERMLGFSVDEMVGREDALLNLIHEEDRHKAIGDFNDFISSSDRVANFEYRIWKKGKEDFFWIRERVSVTRDNGGDPVEIYGVIMDITEERIARQRLLIQQNIVDSIYRTAPIGIGLAVHRLITNANHGLCQMLGYSQQELIGQSTRIIYKSEEEYERIGRLLYTINGSKQVQTIDSELRNRKGESVFVHMTALLMDGESIANGVVFSVTDVSHLMRIQDELEEARQNAIRGEKLKAAFIANMSHEIRTPMNAIVGFSDLLTEDELLPDLKLFYIAQILQNSDQLLAIVNDILDISRIDSGEVKICREPVVVKYLLDSVQASHELQAIQKNIRIIRIKEGDRVHEPVMLDLSKTRQILDNLMVNAIKFTDTGFIYLGYDYQDGFLKFFVEDTGMGIPYEKTEIIFERFHQEETFLTKRFRGAGLGLSICKKLVNLMGGEIGVTSKVNEGSKFWFTVPCVFDENKMSQCRS